MDRFDDPFIDRFIGGLIGLMVGDALGMPVEGWPAARIEARHHWLAEMIPGRFPAGSYTDDCQMAIGLLESLIQAGGFDPAVCAARYLANFDPHRGYGGRIQGVMDRLAGGGQWDEAGTNSFGNGAAMRVGPVGLWFAADSDGLTRAALDQARITHTHPQGLAGALVQAVCVAEAFKVGLEGRPLEPAAVISELSRRAGAVDQETAQRIESLGELKPAPPPQLRAQLGRLFAGDVRAIEAVGPAVGAVLLTASFEEAVSLAVNLGGDTDTMGAMAGAAAGAYYGASAIPERWWKTLENEPGSGRDYLVGLGRQAVKLLGH